MCIISSTLIQPPFFGQVHHRARECSRVLDLLSDLDSARPVENVLPTSRLDLLDSFRDLLDLERVSIAGHSFGGATVLATMAEDKRFK